MDATAAEKIICVDLDGTLSAGDTMVIGGWQLFRRRPWLAPMFLFWHLWGRAALKREIAKRVPFDPATLVYNRELIAWLKQQRAAGARLVLASGSDESVVAAVTAHLGLFDEFYGSDGKTNLTGPYKAAFLASRFPHFAYVGDSLKDLAVWRRADACYLAGRDPRLIAKLSAQVKFERIFQSWNSPATIAA
jgi:phosphoserine phosphatase